MTISWSAVSGATGYNVYRGGSKVNGSLVSGASFNDSGLSPGTTYSCDVCAATFATADCVAATASTCDGTDQVQGEYYFEVILKIRHNRSTLLMI